MMQARLAANLPPVVREAFGNLQTDAQRAIQFVRSTPGVAAPLCGMKQAGHVRENLAVAQVAPAPDRVVALFAG